MSAESALRAVLIADPAVSALIGSRVYPDLMPQTPTLPAIVCQRIDSIPGLSCLEGPAFNVRARVQLSLWAGSFDASRALAAAVVAALGGYSGTTPEGDLRLVLLANLLDDYEPETKLFRVIADFHVYPKEGVAV